MFGKCKICEERALRIEEMRNAHSEQIQVLKSQVEMLSKLVFAPAITVNPPGASVDLDALLGGSSEIPKSVSSTDSERRAKVEAEARALLTGNF
jgi:hypothetical protein